jgi:hypothetical protein
MAGDSTTTIVMVLVLVIILCSSCSSSVTVLANENPSFGGSFLDFLRGDWYNNIFGYPVAPPGEYENEGEGVDAGGNGGDNEDDGDKDNDKDRSKPKDNCVYLYKNKNGKKYLISKCTSSTKTYKGSNVEEVSSIKVGKDLTVYVYDKDNKKKMYKGNKNKTYNLSSKWDNKTKKLVLKHKDGGGSSGGGGSSKGENSGGSDSCSSKICLYEHRDYGGKYLGFNGEDRIYDFRNNSHMKGKISSMKIDGGHELTAYMKPRYSGDKKTFSGNTHWIGNTWNDNINSFVIYKKGESPNNVFKNPPTQGSSQNTSSNDISNNQLTKQQICDKYGRKAPPHGRCKGSTHFCGRCVNYDDRQKIVDELWEHGYSYGSWTPSSQQQTTVTNTSNGSLPQDRPKGIPSRNR